MLYRQLIAVIACGALLTGCGETAPAFSSPQTTTSAATSPTDTTTNSTATTTAEAPTTTTAAILTPEVVAPRKDLADDTFVRVKDYIPDAFVELKYATTDNFTGQVIYDFNDAYLRFGTVKKLEAVQNTLREQGLYLKIWDSFRPVSAQFDLWDAYPDATYVANPHTGYSSHNRGNTVDVTLVTADGTELLMPTAFDDFTTLANRDYSDCDDTAAKNAALLETIMTANGFQPYFAEWWHFSDSDSYPVDADFDP